MSMLALLTATSFRSPVIFTIGDGPELTSSRLFVSTRYYAMAGPKDINLLQSTPRGRENGVQWHTKLDKFGFNTKRR
jgi:hypothetical protein